MLNLKKIAIKENIVLVYSLALTIVSTLFVIVISRQMIGDQVPDEEAVALSLGFFILGQFLGFVFFNRLNIKNILMQLFAAEFLLAVLLTCALPIYFLGFSIVKIFFYGYLVKYTYIYLLTVSFCVGFLSGGEMPSLVRYLGGQNRHWTLMLAVNYFGLLVAYLSSATYFLPTYAICGTAYFCAQLCQVMLVFLSFNLFFLQKINIKFKTIFGAIVIFICLQAVSFYQVERLNQIYLKSKYSKLIFNSLDIESLKLANKTIWQSLDIYSLTTRFQTIDLQVENPEQKNFTLYLNGNIQFSQSSVDSYHEIFSAAAFLYIKEAPQKVLILGGGDGILANALLSAYSVNQIDLVELDSEMIIFSKENEIIRRLNHDSLVKKNIHIYTKDGWTFLNENEKSKNKYDIIFCDFPFPNSFDTVKLYSYEFYLSVSRSLSDQGILVFDGPLQAKNKFGKFIDIVGASLRKAEFIDIRQHGADEGFFVASKTKLEPDFDRIKNKLSLKSLFLMGSGRLALKKDAVVNSVFQEMTFE